MICPTHGDTSMRWHQGRRHRLWHGTCLDCEFQSHSTAPPDRSGLGRAVITSHTVEVPPQLTVGTPQPISAVVLDYRQKRAGDDQ